MLGRDLVGGQESTARSSRAFDRVLVSRLVQVRLTLVAEPMDLFQSRPGSSALEYPTVWMHVSSPVGG